MDLSNVSKNKKRSKKKDFNEFSKVTDLVKKYKVSNSEDDLLEILKNLEGIVNTYTLVLTPGNQQQQIYITPYMKKLLGMFMTPDEKALQVQGNYNKAMDRIRWIMRRYTYEDIYSHVLYILISTIKKMKVVGDCDCIYYIQLIVRFKIHDLILKTSKDTSTSVAELPMSLLLDGENTEDIIDRLSFNQADVGNSEDDIIDNMYKDISIDVLLKSDDIFKVFSSYEKYVIYLKDILSLTNRQILSILKHESSEELFERFDDITLKCKLIMEEGN